MKGLCLTLEGCCGLKMRGVMMARNGELREKSKNGRWYAFGAQLGDSRVRARRSGRSAGTDTDTGSSGQLVHCRWVGE